VSQIEQLLTNASKNSDFVMSDFFESMVNGRTETVDVKWSQSSLIQAIKNRFEAFNVDYAEKQAINDFQIPKILHFIWLGSSLPERVLYCIQTWKIKHSEYEIKIWDESCLQLINWYDHKIEAAFHNAHSFAEKADYLRIQILYQYGGIYVDTDFLCLKSIDSLRQNNVEFFAGFEMPNSWAKSKLYICNALMGSTAYSEILKRYFSLFQTIEEAPHLDPNHRSGPGIISKILEDAIEEDEHCPVLILPCSYFYPTPYEWNWELVHERFSEFESMIQPETYAVHLWAKSWK
jgi:inositol phosphorylceramide mannosyltransferase catalytic subunit